MLSCPIYARNYAGSSPRRFFRSLRQLFSADLLLRQWAESGPAVIRDWSLTSEGPNLGHPSSQLSISNADSDYHFEVVSDRVRYWIILLDDPLYCCILLGIESFNFDWRPSTKLADTALLKRRWLIGLKSSAITFSSGKKSRFTYQLLQLFALTSVTIISMTS